MQNEGYIRTPPHTGIGWADVFRVGYTREVPTNYFERTPQPFGRDIYRTKKGAYPPRSRKIDIHRVKPKFAMTFGQPLGIYHRDDVSASTLVSFDSSVCGSSHDSRGATFETWRFNTRRSPYRGSVDTGMDRVAGQSMFKDQKLKDHMHAENSPPSAQNYEDGLQMSQQEPLFPTNRDPGLGSVTESALYSPQFGDSVVDSIPSWVQPQDIFPQDTQQTKAFCGPFELGDFGDSSDVLPNTDGSTASFLHGTNAPNNTSGVDHSLHFLDAFDADHGVADCFDLTPIDLDVNPGPLGTDRLLQAGSTENMNPGASEVSPVFLDVPANESERAGDECAKESFLADQHNTGKECFPLLIDQESPIADLGFDPAHPSPGVENAEVDEHDHSQGSGSRGDRSKTAENNSSSSFSIWEEHEKESIDNGIARRPRSKVFQKPPTTTGISLENLKEVFHLHRPDAERHLNLKRTTFSNLSRFYGISKWPFRTLRDADKRMAHNQELLRRPSTSRDKRRKLEIQQRRLRAVKELMYAEPSQSKDSNTLSVLLNLVAEREKSRRS